MLRAQSRTAVRAAALLAERLSARYATVLRGAFDMHLTRDRLTQGIDVSGTPDGLRIDLHVVVEYGLNLAEVAATVRSRVAYELERLTGLKVAAVEVHIEDVRRSA